MRQFYKTISVLGFATLQATTVHATEPTNQEMAQAAGYKAMFTCSATFNAGKTPDMIARHELTNIYPSLDMTMARVGKAEIHTVKNTSALNTHTPFPHVFLHGDPI